MNGSFIPNLGYGSTARTVPFREHFGQNLSFEFGYLGYHRCPAGSQICLGLASPYFQPSAFSPYWRRQTSPGDGSHGDEVQSRFTAPAYRLNHEHVTISENLRLRMAKRLELDPRLETNIQGLYALYGAWCRNVPFDNVRKLIALRSGDAGPLPGGDATDFLENFLEHGTGATCWGSSNALFELVTAFGFQARRVAGSMRDLGVPGHGSVKVTINGMDWMVDSSMLTMFPIPITNELSVYRDPRFGVEVEPTPEGSHLVWFNTPPYEDYFPCRLLIDDVTHDFYLERYEISRTRGPFNHHISIRYNRGDARTVLQGHTRHRTTDALGLVSQPLTRDELLAEMRQVIGLSDAIVKRWADCGALEAQYEPPENPPALLTVKPPSTRGA